MRPKEIRIWTGKRLNDPVKVERRSTLKSLCSVIGIKYPTAKERQNIDGGVTLWMVNDTEAWEIWVETIEK